MSISLLTAYLRNERGLAGTHVAVEGKQPIVAHRLYEVASCIRQLLKSEYQFHNINFAKRHPHGRHIAKLQKKLEIIIKKYSLATFGVLKR